MCIDRIGVVLRCACGNTQSQSRCKQRFFLYALKGKMMKWGSIPPPLPQAWSGALIWNTKGWRRERRSVSPFISQRVWNGWSFITRLGPLIKRELPNFTAKAPNEVENMDMHVRALQRWVGFGGFIFHTRSWRTHLCAVGESLVGSLAASHISACQWSVLQNHRMVWVGRDVWRSSSLPPWYSANTAPSQICFLKKIFTKERLEAGVMNHRERSVWCMSCAPCDQHGAAPCVSPVPRPSLRYRYLRGDSLSQQD